MMAISLVHFDDDKKKYYGVYGINGFGVYQDYEKLQESLKYLYDSEIEEFDSERKARAYARGNYAKIHYLSKCSPKNGYTVDHMYYLRELETRKKKRRPF